MDSKTELELTFNGNIDIENSMKGRPEVNPSYC